MQVKFKNESTLHSGVLELRTKLLSYGLDLYLGTYSSMYGTYSSMYSTFRKAKIEDELLTGKVDSWSSFVAAKPNIEGLTPLVDINGKLTVVHLIEGELYLAALEGFSLTEVFVIGNDSDYQLITNLIRLNKIALEHLAKQLDNNSMYNNFPWVKHIEYKEDKVTVLCECKLDTDRRSTAAIHLVVKQDNNYLGLREIKTFIKGGVELLEGEHLLIDTYGIMQDLEITNKNIQAMYSFVVSKYLLSMGISKPEELSKLNDVSDVIVIDDLDLIGLKGC